MSKDHSKYLEYKREIDENITQEETDDMPCLEMSEFFREGDQDV